MVSILRLQFAYFKIKVPFAVPGFHLDPRFDCNFFFSESLLQIVLFPFMDQYAQSLPKNSNFAFAAVFSPLPTLNSCPPFSPFALSSLSSVLAHFSRLGSSPALNSLTNWRGVTFFELSSVWISGRAQACFLSFAE